MTRRRWCGGVSTPTRVPGRGPAHHRPPVGTVLDPRSNRGLLSRGMAGIEAHITGTVWKIEVTLGDTVEEGDTVVILESMKMEMPVEAEDEGTVKEILVAEGQSVSEGDTLVVLG